MKKGKRKREPDELDRRILAKLESWGGPLSSEELDRRMLAKIEELGGPLTSEQLDRRMLAKIAELEARNAAKRGAGGT